MPNEVFAIAIVSRCPLCKRRLEARASLRSGGLMAYCTGAKRSPRCDWSTPILIDHLFAAYTTKIRDLQRELDKAEANAARSTTYADWSRGSPGMPISEPVDALLKKIIFEFHPDRAGEKVSTTDLVAFISQLRANRRSR